jgi:hypothetical protein
MQVPRRGVKGKYPERPPLCICFSEAWWNGTREVCAVCMRDGSAKHITGIVCRRARCRSEDCGKSWTVYEPYDSYPHRVFWLAVVVSAVSAVVFNKATMTAAAKTHQCCRDSVRRWLLWVERLADPADLMRVCTQLDCTGMPGATATTDMPKAGAVIYLMDRLAELLAQRGVMQQRSTGLGLISVLKRQLGIFGQVFYLKNLSPPMRADVFAARL